MKKIEAIIRREKLANVRMALEEIGYPGMTISEVTGHGKQKGLTQQWRGQEYKVEFLPKLKLEIVILDQDVGKTLSAIKRSARTGEMGDGKIFVMPIDSAVRIRTGDDGEDAI
jgi:nitrogen regulatory protein P-II 1